MRLLSVCAVGLTMAGCGGQDKKASPGAGRLFAVSFQTMNNPFFVELNEGLQRVVESHGDRLVTLDAQFNSLKQKGDVADVLQQRPAALFLNPVNWEGIKGSLLEARRQNVPVIVIDAPVSDPGPGSLPGRQRQRGSRAAGLRGAGEGEPGSAAWS